MTNDPQSGGNQAQPITLVLPVEARARLELRRAEAEVEFRRAYQDLIKASRNEKTDENIGGLMVQLAYAVFFAFAEEAVNSRSDTFTVRKSLEAYLPMVVDKVFLANHPDAMRTNRDEQRARFHDMARFIITNSPGWLELQGVLAERAGLEMESPNGSGEVAPAMEKALGDAIELFESHPDFSRVQVRMRERMEEAMYNSSADARAFGSEARLKCVLSLFDLRAEAFWELVSDMRTQNAFMLVLGSLERAAWQEYTGWPIEVARPASAESEADIEAIHARVQQWTKDGYKRLVSSGNGPTRTDGRPAVSVTKGGGADPRAAVDAFILKCNQEISLKVNRRHIWRAVGHTTARQFQFWQASNSKATAQDDQNFRRILAMNPADFQTLLKKKGII